MNTATAEMVLYAITAAAIVVWVEGLRFVISSMRKGQKEAEEFGGLSEPVPAHIIYGSAEVEGNAADLSRKTARMLAAGSYLINERTDEKIVFQSPDEYLPNANTARKMVPGLHRKDDPFAVQSQAGKWLSIHGQMLFTQVSHEKARVEYAISAPKMRNLLISAFVIQALGFIAIVAVFLLMYFLVISSQRSAVRWQVVQMIQVIHFLWPPYLLAVIYRKPAKIIRAQFDTFVHNLQYVDE